MKAIKDKYNPNLTIRENAELCNCSESAIRHFIKVSGIDRKYDEAFKRWKLINLFSKQHPSYTANRIAKELGFSRNTITKYLGVEMPSKNDNSKLSKFDGSKKPNNILSTNTNQQSILNNILTLYVPSLHFDVDLTYSKGSFYRKGIVAQPTYKFDKYPQTEDTIDLTEIDNIIGDGKADSVIYDLPYMIRHPWISVKSKIIELYSAFNSLEELIKTNKNMLELAARKLRRGGILVVKTQDTSTSTPRGVKQIWVSQVILNHAEDLGFKHEDTFILITSKLLFTHHERQHRARKSHCYFFVFRK